MYTKNMALEVCMSNIDDTGYVIINDICLQGGFQFKHYYGILSLFITLSFSSSFSFFLSPSLSLNHSLSLYHSLSHLLKRSVFLPLSLSFLNTLFVTSSLLLTPLSLSFFCIFLSLYHTFFHTLYHSLFVPHTPWLCFDFTQFLSLTLS